MRARHPLRDKAVTHVMGGAPAKAFASLHGVSYQWVIKTLYNAGLKRFYLTDSEREHIMSRRQTMKQIL